MSLTLSRTTDYLGGMAEPLPANLALAVKAWAMVEAHLIAHCGLGQSVSLEKERPALIRIMVAALDPLPAPESVHVAGAEVVASPAPAPIPFEPAFTPRIRKARKADAVWFDGLDLIGLDQAIARTDGPGYDCRQCGVRVRGARHTNPRLVCPTCTTAAIAG